MMDCCLDPLVREIIVKKSTQIGWSDGVLNNVVGYFIACEPKAMLMVQPTEFSAKTYSRKRITPMIESCAALKAKVREKSSRRHGSSMLMKEFDGGSFRLTGASAGAGLRGDPIEILMLDEEDGYPDDVEGEGDPIIIALRRTDTYETAKIFKGSTPAKPRGFSRIDDDYERSSQGIFEVPCPFCGFMQPLLWRGERDEHDYRLVFERDRLGEVIAASVRFLCAGCGRGIEERYKQRMLEAGAWRHRWPKRDQVRGFYINALYSPWRLLWHELAQEFIDATDNPEKLKAFINLRLGESWEGETGKKVGAAALLNRAEDYQGCEVPPGVAVLVGSVDVQPNRLEAQITGFGAGEEQWLIGYEVFWGDPAAGADPETGVDVWQELDRWLLREWAHKSGVLLRPYLTLVDSGNQSDAVYDFVTPRQFAPRRVLACKGVDYLSKPGLAQEGQTKRGAVRLFTLATYAIKDRIFARLKLANRGPGFMHFPEWATLEYFEQLDSERKITVRDKRTRAKKYLYVKSYNRNEALDLTVYAHAALFILQTRVNRALFQDLGQLAERLNQGEDPYPSVSPRLRRTRSAGVE